MAALPIIWYIYSMNSKAKLEAVERYNKKTYDKITVRVRKDEAERIRAAVGDRSLNGFILDAIREKISSEKK